MKLRALPPVDYMEADHAAADYESDPASEFTIFPKLPLELKDMIWKFALPDPRIVGITSHAIGGPDQIPYSSDYEDGVLNESFVFKVDVNALPMGLFLACSRSRKIALQRYELAFGSRLTHPIYFDFKRDTLYLYGWYTYSYFLGYEDPEGHKESFSPPPDLEVWRPKVQHMAIQMPRFICPECTAVTLKGWATLSTLTLEIHGPGDEYNTSRYYKKTTKNQELKIRKTLMDSWKEALQTEDETLVPRLEFVSGEEMEAGGHFPTTFGRSLVIEEISFANSCL